MAQRKKVLILNVLDILKRYSDADHRLTVSNIVGILEKEYDMTVDRKAVKRSLEDLEDFGYRIDSSTSTRTKKDGSTEELQTDWYLSADFSESELRLIVDSLMCSRYISHKQLNNLVRKIEDLGNTYFSKKLTHLLTLHEELPENSELFLNIEILEEAIDNGKKVTFQYYDYGTDKKMSPRKDGSGKTKTYTVDPYQMITANCRYYLLGHCDAYDDVSHYRIDRMKHVRLTDTPSENKYAAGIGTDLSTHLAEHIYMFCGENGAVTFRANKIILNDIIDWFGTDIRFFDETEDKVSVSVRVNYQAMKYWALQYCSHVKVMSPPALVEDIGNALSAAADKYKSTHHEEEKI